MSFIEEDCQYVDPQQLVSNFQIKEELYIVVTDHRNLQPKSHVLTYSSILSPSCLLLSPQVLESLVER